MLVVQREIPTNTGSKNDLPNVAIVGVPEGNKQSTVLVRVTDSGKSADADLDNGISVLYENGIPAANFPTIRNTQTR